MTSGTDSRETEVKLRVSDLGAVRQSLRRMGAQLSRERHLEDNLLFDDEQASLRERGTVLRLRRTPGAGLLTFKGPRQLQEGVKSREERETRVEDPGALEAILRRLGYQPVFRYQKYRESWSHRGQAIEVDETPIGSFLEIEGDLEGIHAVAAELGFSPRDYVDESYVGLFFASGGEGDMVFPPR
ncbi:MAG TPA: class IV adenylate cyclase [Vicinamibacteria bacterium]|nr:class IV adenylate cyclase [Vicinamibacteria bacterium]